MDTTGWEPYWVGDWMSVSRVNEQWSRDSAALPSQPTLLKHMNGRKRLIMVALLPPDSIDKNRRCKGFDRNHAATHIHQRVKAVKVLGLIYKLQFYPSPH